MSRHSSPAFSVKVRAYGPEALSVSGFSGTESMSRLFDFRVDFFTRDGEPLAIAELVGQEARVTLSVRDDLRRFVHGQVHAVDSLGLKTGRQRYRAHVVPKPWRLTQRHRSRIFQSKSVPDILKAVLGEAGGVGGRTLVGAAVAPRLTPGTCWRWSPPRTTPSRASTSSPRWFIRACSRT